ncbi:MAG: tetratricopeptide repeat protein [Woeseiaceae bacterium]|nr:tetratricopeptide repeat protein [Woeseiaceae bacterium]
MLPLVAVAMTGAADVQAQTDPEEELEIIELENPYDESQSAGDEEQIFEGLIYDQKTEQYRLVADPEEEDEEEPPSQREVDKQELGRLFNLYKESLSNQNFLEADTLAKQIVELSIRIYGINSEESAKALTNLAIAQHNNGEFEAAERNYEASIDIIEQTSDRLNEALINPLKGLGATQLAIGRPDLARSTLQRAVHVSHVNEGPHNKDQVEVLESIAEIYLAIGEHKDAVDMQERVFTLQSRNIDPKSLDIIPPLEKQARWQHRLQLYERERSSWRHIISVLEKHHGKNDLRLIPPLTSLGKSYLFITPVEYEMQTDVSVASGETYLRRANRIADDNPDSTWEIREQTMLALGDYYVLSARPNRAGRVYVDLWEYLSEDEERHGNRRDHLERLNLLQNIYPPKYYESEQTDERLPRDEEFETGTVSYGFIVNSSGRPSNIQHIETRPPEFTDMQERVRRNLRHLVYRPRLAEGKVVSTPDVVYTHEFYYRPEDIPATPGEEESAQE